MNLAEQYAAWRLRAEKVWAAEASAAWPWAAIFALFAEAEETLARAWGLGAVTWTIPLTAGPADFFYPLPGGLVAGDVAGGGVQIVPAAGGSAQIRTLTRITADEARGLFGDFTNPGGVAAAAYWWLNDDGRIGIGPPEGATGSLRITGAGRPVAGDSARNIAAPAVTAALTYGLAAAPLSAGVAPGALPPCTVASPLELGVGTLAAPPSRWWRVASLTEAGGLVTEFTLAEAWSGASAAAAGVILARVGSLETIHPSRASGMGPVYYALAETASEAESAARYGELFRQALASGPTAPAGLTLPGWNPRGTFAHLNR